jgi:hypothetical protein
MAADPGWRDALPGSSDRESADAATLIYRGSFCTNLRD